ncbi:vegetative cell wall gp1 [Fusarium denticulatum]|uniref:Vegetative cell wall gp1 n=1 Tax=Fusarium denticulatum TaxID=48507 RepID=A0A8H5XKX5_9HYPO|nr:vegetative cell wall gp1 [Fusarium denticulatum]
MEVTFGAVGDFISIGVLIKDFIELLDDSRGSAWEYNSLKQQLIFLRLNLDLAKRSYDEYYSTPQFQDIRNTLESVVDEAERRLEDIAVKVQKYTSTLCQGSTERRIKKVARKVQWSLEKKETEKFLLDLNRYTSIIQSLQFDAFARLMERKFDSSKKDQSDTQELVNKLQKDFDHRFASLEDELRTVRTNSANTQQYLIDIGMIVTRRLDMVTQTVNSLGVAVLRGFSGMSYLGTSVLSLLSTMHDTIINRLERPPQIGPYFTFEDYLGVDSIILLNFVDSWNAFEGSLHGKFKGRKGGRRVAQNRFLLQDHQTGDEIDREVHWTLAITPGSRINMSLICEVKEDEDEAQSLKCPFPSCGAICEGVIGTVIQCPSCQQLFRKLPGMSDDEELPIAPNAPDSGIHDPNSKPGSHSSGLDQSRKRKVDPLDKRRSLRAKRKPVDVRDTGSDSDDADLTGIKRVTVLPILRLAIRSIPPDSEADGKVKTSAKRTAFEGQEKSRGLDNVTEGDTAEAPSNTIESPAGVKNKRVSELQSQSSEAQLAFGKSVESCTSYQTSGDYNGYLYDKIPGRGAYVFESVLPSGIESKDPRRSGEKTKRVKWDKLKPRKATEADAKRHKIPADYSLKNWDPDEEPIMLLSSVFDANTLGKWIYDWSIYAHGPSTSVSDMAGELWLQLIQLAGKLKRAEETMEKVKSVDSRETVEEFIESGERLWDKLVSLLKRAEYPMLQAYKLQGRKRKTTVHKQGGSDDSNENSSQEAKAEAGGSNKELEETSVSNEGGNVEETGEQKQNAEESAGVAFIETIFGRDKELERTEKWMRNKVAEIAKMTGIYQDAIITISASCASSADRGFLEVRTPYPPAVALPVQTGKGYAVAQLVEENHGRYSKPEVLDLNGIIYGKNRWKALVGGYSGRRLSYLQDRSVAFAGVAQAYCQANSLKPDDYLAGLWKQTLLKDLLWTVNPSTHPFDPSGFYLRSVDNSTEDPYIAPSWSWVSALYPVLWVTKNLAGTAEVISTKIELVQPDLRFGAVKSGSIRLRGFLHHDQHSIDWSDDVTREYQRESDSHTHKRTIFTSELDHLEGEHVWFFEIGVLQGTSNDEQRPIGEVDPFHEEDFPEEECCEEDRSEEDCSEEEHPRQHTNLHGRISGLMLLSTGKENEFTRVGIYEEDQGEIFDDDFFDESCKWCALNKERKLTEIEIV